MNKWIDSHAHIFSDVFKEDIQEVIERASAVGVSQILMPNIDIESIEAMHQIEQDYPNMCYSMMGLHPCSVKEDFEEQLQVVKSWLDKRSYIAIGEVGTDLYWEDKYWELQQEALRVQTKWSLDYDLPLVIHCRNSIDETITLFDSWDMGSYKGVFHCFTGTLQQAKQAIALGFDIGIGGVLTFKNGGIRSWVHELPREHTLLETDSPYLAPTPFRGKRNEPHYIPVIAEILAIEWGCTLEEVAKITSTNTRRLFSKVNTE